MWRLWVAASKDRNPGLGGAGSFGRSENGQLGPELLFCPGGIIQLLGEDVEGILLSGASHQGLSGSRIGCAHPITAGRGMASHRLGSHSPTSTGGGDGHGFSTTSPSSSSGHPSPSGWYPGLGVGGCGEAGGWGSFDWGEGE